MGELPATRVRQQSVVIARAVYLIVGVVIQQLVPRMLSPQEWNWGARCGLFFLGTNLISLAYCYLRLPESKGRTYGELEILFEEKVPARKFSQTKVDGESQLSKPKLMTEFGVAAVYEQHMEKPEEKHVETL